MSGKNRTEAVEKSRSAASVFFTAGKLIKLRVTTTLLAEHRSSSATSSHLSFAIAGTLLAASKALAA
ncbi:MAG: hypothetical protein ABI977_05365 [Acidobacteriota bacterium]